MLLPLYLRRKPTTDPIVAKHAPDARRFDVVAYRDPEARDVKARWPWRHSGKPDRRFKRVTLNCYQWRVVWLPPLETEART